MGETRSSIAGFFSNWLQQSELKPSEARNQLGASFEFSMQLWVPRILAILHYPSHVISSELHAKWGIKETSWHPYVMLVLTGIRLANLDIVFTVEHIILLKHLRDY